MIASAMLGAGARTTRRRARRSSRSRPEPDAEQSPGQEQELYDDKEVWHYINPSVGYCQVWPVGPDLVMTQPRLWQPVAFYWNRNRNQWQPYRWQEITPPPFEWHEVAPFRSASEISSESSSAGSAECYMLDFPNETQWAWRDGIGTCRVHSRRFWKPVRFLWNHQRGEWQPYRFTPVR